MDQKQQPGVECGDVLRILLCHSLPFHWGKKVEGAYLYYSSVGRYHFCKILVPDFCTFNQKFLVTWFLLSQIKCLWCFLYFLVSQSSFLPFAAIPMLEVPWVQYLFHFLLEHWKPSIFDLVLCIRCCVPAPPSCPSSAQGAARPAPGHCSYCWVFAVSLLCVWLGLLPLQLWQAYHMEGRAFTRQIMKQTIR